MGIYSSFEIVPPGCHPNERDDSAEDIITNNQDDAPTEHTIEKFKLFSIANASVTSSLCAIGVVLLSKNAPDQFVTIATSSVFLAGLAGAIIGRQHGLTDIENGGSLLSAMGKQFNYGASLATLTAASIGFYGMFSTGNYEGIGNIDYYDDYYATLDQRNSFEDVNIGDDLQLNTETLTLHTTAPSLDTLGLTLRQSAQNTGPVFQTNIDIMPQTMPALVP